MKTNHQPDPEFMKKMIVYLFLPALLAMVSVSCTQYYAASPAYGSGLGKTQPDTVGIPTQVDMGSHRAYVYSNAVKMTAKAGTVYPLQIDMFDLSGDGIYDIVYTRSGPQDSWLVYHKIDQVQGITHAPNTLTAKEAMSYFDLGYKAKAKVPKPKPKPIEVKTPSETWYRVYPSEH